MTKRAAVYFAAALLGMAAATGACSGSSTGPSPSGPSIVCPSPQTAQSPDGNGVAVAYPAPSVTGGALPVATSCIPASGTSFAVGSTTVACTARDAQQRTASCTFGVTVAAPAKLSATRFVAFGDSI